MGRRNRSPGPVGRPAASRRTRTPQMPSCGGPGTPKRMSSSSTIAPSGRSNTRAVVLALREPLEEPRFARLPRGVDERAARRDEALPRDRPRREDAQPADAHQVAAARDDPAERELEHRRVGRDPRVVHAFGGELLACDRLRARVHAQTEREVRRGDAERRPGGDARHPRLRAVAQTQRERDPERQAVSRVDDRHGIGRRSACVRTARGAGFRSS